MRKKTLYNIADIGLWSFIYLLPILIYLIGNFHNTITFSNCISQIITLTNTNTLYVNFKDVFSNSVYLNFINSSSVIYDYLYYFMIMNIIHIFVDIVLFIPRLIHSIINNNTEE